MMAPYRKIATTVITAAMLVALPFIKDHEGRSLQAYQDVAGVWTVCDGKAGVDKNTVMTDKQCDDLTYKTTFSFMTSVALLIPNISQSQILAAHTSFAYNIGINGYKTSQTRLLTNAGKVGEGCIAMLNWHSSGGRDCRKDKGNKRGCYGLYTRRIDEKNLCLKGDIDVKR